MAFPTKDGKRKFGSAYVAKRYDEVHGEPKNEETDSMEHEASESPEFEAGEQEGAKEENEQAEMHPVVKEHGPAHKVTITHDHEGKKHHVMSHHKDGHVHEEMHEDAKSAHELGGHLANVDLKKSGEAGDQQGAASEGDNDHVPDGFVMPELS